MSEKQGILKRLEYYADCIDKGIHVTGSQLKRLVMDIREQGGVADAIASLSAQQPPAEAQPCGCGEATCTVPWEPGCGLGKSEQHAEAQAQGGDGASEFASYLQECDDCAIQPDVAGAFNAGWRSAQAQGGGEVEFDGTDGEVLREFIRLCRDVKPVGQWPGERVCAAIERSMANERPFRFIAEADMSPEREPSMKDTDRALSGPRHNTAPPSAPVGVEKAARRLLEAYDDSVHPFEAATAAEELRNALAPQPASDGGFTAADMMDARQEGRKEAQQPAAVDGAMSPQVAREWLLGLMGDYDFTLPRDAFSEIVDALSAQPGGSDNDR